MIKNTLLFLFSAILSSMAVYGSWWGGGDKSTKQHPGPGSSMMMPTTDMLRSLVSSMMPFDSSQIPRIYRSPSSYNAILDLPGFSPEDLKVTVNEDTIHIEGHTWCPQSDRRKPSTSWFGENYVPSDREVCVERHVDASFSLPKNMEEHGDIQALLENGVLRVCVPLQSYIESKGYARRIVDVITGGAQKAKESIVHGQEKVSHMVGETLHSAQEQARDTKEYAQEKAKGVKKSVQKGAERVGETAKSVQESAGEYSEEYIKRPAQYAGEKVAERVRDAGRNVAEQAEKTRRYVKPEDASSQIYSEEQDEHSSKGIYERASEAMHKAGETIMHPFRKTASEQEPENLGKERVPVKEGKLNEEL